MDPNDEPPNNRLPNDELSNNDPANIEAPEVATPPALDYGRPPPREANAGGVLGGIFGSSVILFGAFAIQAVQSYASQGRNWWPAILGLGLWIVVAAGAWQLRQEGRPGWWIGIWIGAGVMALWFGWCMTAGF